MGKLQDLTGKRFNRLTVIKRTENKGKRVMWICKCDCGKICTVQGNNLKNGNTKSCGCYKKENSAKLLHKHGKKNSRLYSIYHGMKKRCYNKNSHNYFNYGGRGIKICQDWLDDFMNFYNWSIQNGYNDNLSIDRINNNGNYCPENCRWTSRTVQNINQRTRKDNKTGTKGIYFRNDCKKFVVRIQINKKRINLGQYDTIEEAEKVRKEAENKYWENF